jgi:hypothetical protein
MVGRKRWEEMYASVLLVEDVPAKEARRNEIQRLALL